MSVDLIVNALVAGAAAGASATATTAVTDAYAGVKEGVRRLLHRAAAAGVVDGDPDEVAHELIVVVETNPEASRPFVTERLTRLLTDSGGVDDEEDAELLAAARRLVASAGTHVRVGKYHVELRDNTGVQIGDHNEMTLNVGTQERRQR